MQCPDCHLPIVRVSLPPVDFWETAEWGVKIKPKGTAMSGDCPARPRPEIGPNCFFRHRAPNAEGE